MLSIRDTGLLITRACFFFDEDRSYILIAIERQGKQYI